MRVLITGGTGQIGTATVQRLVQGGWEVHVVGLETGVIVAGATYATCDITNYDELCKQMRGCDAVIHLGAIRGPQLAPGHKIFQVNVSGTFNVFEAAAAAGIRRIVQASSINAIGAAWNTSDMALDYFPVDEAHPCFTTDPYSFSKEMIENIGNYYWRRDGISSVALRFPGVYDSDYIRTESYRVSREKMHRMLDSLAALSEAERQERLTEVRERALVLRKKRTLEHNADTSQWPKRDSAEALLFFAYASDRFNLWAWLDVRDAAQSLEKGVTADYAGAHALFVNDHHNRLGYDSRTLVRLFFPAVQESHTRLSGAMALVSMEKARTLIGFEPEYSVANWEDRDNQQTEKQQ